MRVVSRRRRVLLRWARTERTDDAELPGGESDVTMRVVEVLR